MKITDLLVVAISAIVFITIFYYDKEEAERQDKQDLQYTMEQFNKMSIKAKALQDRVDELEEANHQLIKVCKPVSLNTAIKHTSMPKLVEV